MRKFIAVYIDLENVAPILNLDKMLQDIILEAQEDAEEYIFAVKFACGNSRSISKVRTSLVNYNFEIREAPHVTGKKNRADLIISLEAFEKLYLDKPHIDRFVFVTSDSDFSVIMDILRKFGREVWLITRECDGQRPIFTNSTDNIIIIPEKEKTALRRVKKTPRTPVESKAKPSNTEDPKIEIVNPRDRLADDLFIRVLISLDPSEDHNVNSISNKMRQLDKSFKIKNTRYKRMATLVREFERKGLFKTHKSKDGHLLLTDLNAL